MNKKLLVGLFITLLAPLLLFLVSRSNGDEPTVKPKEEAVLPTIVVQNQERPSQNNGYTLQSVSSHDSETDCWLLIDEKVYDVTSYLGKHPAGAKAILPYCGGDATTAFNTRGGSDEGHSSKAIDLLANYYVGNLVR